MTTGVTLIYNAAAAGGAYSSCHPVSSPIQNATVHEIMNRAANLYTQKDAQCMYNGLPGGVSYITKFVKNFDELVFACFHWYICQPPVADYNMSQVHWQMYINDKAVYTPMSTTHVASNDKISWIFEKIAP